MCVGKNDMDVIERTIPLIQKNVIGMRKIYLLCVSPEHVNQMAIVRNHPSIIKVIDERIFPFSIDTMFEDNKERNGWYLQQLLKMYAGIVIPDISPIYLVIDCDVFFFQPTSFLSDNGKFLLTTSYLPEDAYHRPYFSHMNRLHPSLNRYYNKSGIAHHFLFHREILRELFQMVENYYNNQEPFWRLFFMAVDPKEYKYSGASEYEIYFQYLIRFHSDKIMVRSLPWMDLPYITTEDVLRYSYVAVHHYNRLL